MEALGIPRGSYLVKVNNRKVLDGVLEAIGLNGEANAGKRLTVLRAIDKFDRLGRQGVELLLTDGRRDDSGDFTKGAGLDAKQAQNILNYVELRFPQTGDVDTVFDDWSKSLSLSSTGKDGVHELKQIARLVRAGGYGADRIAFEFERRARPRILHRPRVRSGFKLFDRRRRWLAALRLGRRRRPL